MKGVAVFSLAETDRRALVYLLDRLCEYEESVIECHSVVAQAIAETYARDPKFYGGTFCTQCRTHLPVDEFVWAGTQERVGS